MIEQDTIAAIATALGEGSIGVIRVSGPEAKEISHRVLRHISGQAFHFSDERSIGYGHVVDPHTGELLDEAVVLSMPGPKSYTAEDVVEIQVHGGTRMVEAVLDAILRAGARIAEPGEFTKRAFLNGRIDLSQAEAVIDVIRAKTDLAGRAALRQVKGSMSEKVQTLRKQIIALQALVEVTIDYPEHDVEDEALAQVILVGEAVKAELTKMVQSAKMGQILREGVATAIVGRPNVGKSSLLNALLRRDRAIVTDIPGTTRDVIEEYVNVRGIPLRLIDTAGIRETEDVVEKFGVLKSREMLEEAQIVFVVLNWNEPLLPVDYELLEDTMNRNRIIVVNKVDLPSDWANIDMQGLFGDSPIVHLSARLHEGIGALEEVIEKLLTGGHVESQDTTYLTNARQSALLRAALEDLNAAIVSADSGTTLDLIAVELQSVYAELGRIIGEEVGEDLLDEIFSNFCLGK